MKKIILLMLAAFGAHANAAVISADFATQADLLYSAAQAPYYQGPAKREVLNMAVDGNVELGPDAAYSNPSEWQGGTVFIDIDPIAKTLTLLSQDEYDFEFFSATISNIRFGANEVITGLTALSDNLTADITVTPTLAFTGNSLSITYDAMGDYFYFTGDRAVFQYTTAVVDTAVPEPATTGLLMLGAAGLLYSRRRKK